MIIISSSQHGSGGKELYAVGTPPPPQPCAEPGEGRGAPGLSTAGEGTLAPGDGSFTSSFLGGWC